MKSDGARARRKSTPAHLLRVCPGLVAEIGSERTKATQAVAMRSGITAASALDVAASLKRTVLGGFTVRTVGS